MNPYMYNICVQFVLGSTVLHTTETKYVLADNNQFIGDKISWNIISKMPMETVLTFKIHLYTKEGDGIVCGVGAMKLFDEYGYIYQGRQEIFLFAK